jgi:hypothetical protein
MVLFNQDMLHPDIILPSRKRRVINLKTIHRGKNQLVFFQALVLPSFNDNCFLSNIFLVICNNTRDIL